jgi:hypothetical protein
MIYPQIITSHPLDRKAPFELGTDLRSIQAWDRMHGGHCRVDRIHNETGRAVIQDFWDGSAAECDHRRPTRMWRAWAAPLIDAKEVSRVSRILLYDPDYWRARAQEARKLAGRMLDQWSKQTLLILADSYEALARDAEARSKHGVGVEAEEGRVSEPK